MNHQNHHHHHLTCQVNRQTDIQTRPIKLPHHIHHPKPRPNWFTPEWLTPWVTTTNHHNHYKQTDIATDMIRIHRHTHLNTHPKVTHHQLYHANISARHQILSTKRDPLPRARIHHLRPVHNKTNLKLNVNQGQSEIQIMFLCQVRPGAAEQCAYLAGTENEFLYETFWS